jgi:YVTN family beta-propeller protein
MMDARMEGARPLKMVWRLPALLVAWLLFLSSACKQDKPPAAPVLVFGPKSGEVDISYSFSTSTWDPEGDSIRYQFDWGDAVGDWTEYVPSGAAVLVSHTWSEHGIHGVRAMAEDKHGKCSEWSSAFPDTIFGYPNRIVATIPVGPNPFGIAPLPDNSRVYVACDGGVWVIRTPDNQVDTMVLEQGRTWGATVVPSGAYVYVDCYVGGYVYGIRTSDNAVTDTILVGGYLDGIVASSDSWVYVADSWDNIISAIRTSDRTVVARIPVADPGSQPSGMAATPDGQYVYVALFRMGEVWVIRTSDNSVVRKIRVSDNREGPAAVAIIPDGRLAYVAHTENGDVAVIRTSNDSLESPISVGSDCVAVLPNGHFVFVTDGISVHVIRTSDNAVVASVRVSDDPWGIAVQPDGERVYVADFNGGSATVLGY